MKMHPMMFETAVMHRGRGPWWDVADDEREGRGGGRGGRRSGRPPRSGPDDQGDDVRDDGPARGGRGRGRGGRGRGGDVPFGWHGPGGPGWMGRFGPPVRRNRGDVRLAALLLLAEGPMHGYQIIREVAERSDGAWKLSPGAVYPTLAQLETEGLVTSTATEGRSVYALTDAGRAEAEKLVSATPPWESAADEDDGLREAVMTLVAAARQVAAIGTDQQRQAAVAALTEARRALYRLLADDPG